MKSIYTKMSMLTAGLLLAGLVSAQGADPYGSLVSAVNFTNVTTDVVAVAALVVVVLVAIRAVRFIFQIVRR
jgi:uncharacterized protein HemY